MTMKLYMMSPEQDEPNWLAPVKTSGNAVELGYQKCEVEQGTHFAYEETAERASKVSPMMPEPVEGGFVPLNNVFERI